MPRLEFIPVSYATPTSREALILVAELWTYRRLTRHCRDAVRGCLSLGISRSDIALHIRFSVYMSHAMITKNKSHDPLYKFIYQRIANIARACGSKKSGTIVQPADGVLKPKGNMIEGMTAKSKSMSCAPLKERDLNKPGVLEEGLQKAEVQTMMMSLLVRTALFPLPKKALTAPLSLPLWSTASMRSFPPGLNTLTCPFDLSIKRGCTHSTA
ncbi:hypothetical protein ACHAW5_000358 [Stephanodiscus triporus]|uniref:Uncharacterized protein n=1 Tax=Stephanodiscus triporus TaxID=2934178 RepID=A0ABD3MTH5_9STRA